ncbi:MAG: PAS domain-containing protein [Candidatus Cloacimonetes bacterium]|nr:PAS domain-containing protein [Candidatus Cloacimonadota bacterium]
MYEWIKSIPFAITVCDKDAIITEMNDKAGESFATDGGLTLIGKKLFDCHSPRSCEIIRHMLATGDANIYTISKAGKRKLIVQQPYRIDGEVAGVVEMSIELPADIPHYERG